MLEPGRPDDASPSLRLDVLGPLDGHLAGVPLELGSPQQRAVLAALALREGGQAEADELVLGLWGDRPPPAAAGTLRTYLSRLRRVLGPAGTLLVATGGGYRLARSGYDLDLAEFQRLRRQATAASGSGDVAVTARHLRAALALWRGAPLSGLPGPYVESQRRRLVQLRTAAVEELLAAELELGRLPEVVAELAVLVPEQPLRERLRELQVLALWRMGRTADALDAYQQARTTLADELGIDPGPALQELHAQVLSGTVPEAPRGAAGATAPRPVPAQLPGVPALVPGRAAALADLVDVASDHPPGASRVLVLAGMGGVGKTTLAVHLARRLAPEHPDGQLYVNLRGFDPARPALEPSAVLAGFLDALGVAPHELPADLDGRSALYRTLLASRRVVVVLDNARDPEQVRPLLPGSPGALVVVTSRGRLSGLVATEGAHPVAVDVLPVDAAREFLRQRLGAARVGTDPGVVDRLVRRTGGLPLALAVVVARAASGSGSPLTVLADELDAAPLDAVATTDATSDLRTVLSSSYRSLAPAAARVFRSLPVHPGPDAGTAAVASGVGLPAAEVRRLLDQLADAALVTGPAPGRWALHDLVSAYAAELTDPAERREELLRVTEHHLRTAAAARLVHAPQRAGDVLPPPPPGVVPEAFADAAAAAAWFDREAEGLTATVAQAAAEGLPELVRQLAWTLLPLQDSWGRPQDALSCLGTALAVTDPGTEPNWAGRLHHGLGIALTDLGRVDGAAEHLRAAAALFHGSGDRLREAQVLASLGNNAVHELLPPERRRPDELVTHLQAALDIATELGDHRNEAVFRNNLGYHLLRQGRPAEGRRELIRSLALFRQVGDDHWIGQAELNLAGADLDSGRVSEALDRYRSAVRTLAAAQQLLDLAEAVLGLGRALRASGDDAGAGQAWREALDVLARLDPSGQLPSTQALRTQVVDALAGLVPPAAR